MPLQADAGAGRHVAAFAATPLEAAYAGADNIERPSDHERELSGVAGRDHAATQYHGVGVHPAEAAAILDLRNQSRNASGTDGPPDVPWAWFYAGDIRQIARGPSRVVIGGRPIAVFLTASGSVGALDARCVHLGADLSRGHVVGECLKCPFHEWAFATSGRCERIPASTTIPDSARQAAFPTAVIGPHVFLFNRGEAAFDLPFFQGVSPSALYPSKPFDFTVDMDWPMVAANGFDLQHFRAAHDRTLRGEPVVDSPSPFARRISADFDVTGANWRDRLTRRFSGPQVTMTVTSWLGTIILVTAKFRRTTSYGMVCVTPIAPGRTRLRTIIWVPRSMTAIGRIVVDPLDAIIRRSFIRSFMQADRDRAVGIRYNPASMIEADRVLARYFSWLYGAVKGEPFHT